MKKFNLFLTLIAVVMLVGLTNCTKNLKDTTPVSKQYVDAVVASFNVVQGVEITTKDLTPTIPLVSQNMYMLTSNANFYTLTSQNSYVPVRGLEFLTGSAGQVFWSNTANNPASFPFGTGVISNLTPAENVRVVVEGSDANSKVAYIGAIDLNSITANFPLNITQYRLGDFLSINTDGLSSLGAINVNVSFDTKAIDLPATRAGGIVSGNELNFGDIKLGIATTNHSVLVSVSPVTVDLYNDVLDKVVGNINITITAGTQVLTLTPIPATLMGHGMSIVLKTYKVGSFDSATMVMTQADIDVTTTSVTVN